MNFYRPFRASGDVWSELALFNRLPFKSKSYFPFVFRKLSSLPLAISIALQTLAKLF